MLSSTVTVASLFPGVTTTFVIGFPSTTVCVGFDTVVGAIGVITAAGLEFASLGFDPLLFSSTSVTPSLSSSGSVTSGSPSLSVSLWTVILNVFVVVFPVASLASTVTVNSLVSSVGPQSVTLGVPLIFPLLYVTPLGRSLTVTVALGVSVVTSISSIGLPSTTVWSAIGLITIEGTELASLGFDPLLFSSTSVYPSLSSSGSVTSGSPSPSVSLSTVIITFLVTLEPLEFVTVTGISNFLDSSFGPQFVIFGLPEIIAVPGSESSIVSPNGTFVLSIFAFESILSGYIFTLFIGFLSTTVCSWFSIDIDSIKPI